MATASRELPRARDASRLERGALAALVVAFVAIVGVGAADAVREARALDERRAAVAAQASDPAQAMGEQAEAFRVFRRALTDGSRFALVYGEDVDRNEAGFYRLFGGYYLYPAVAVERPEDADAVMVFGEPSATLRADFDELARITGIWLGRRAGA